MVIDFGWDWEKYEQDGVKYRRRIEDGRLVVNRWQTTDGYMGRWVPVEVPATDYPQDCQSEIRNQS